MEIPPPIAIVTAESQELLLQGMAELFTGIETEGRWVRQPMRAEEQPTVTETEGR
jgi:hypothetical protein